MAQYAVFVEAVQWTGTNVTEVRQFARSSTEFITDVVIDAGVLYLTVDMGNGQPPERVAVNVTDWMLKQGGIVLLTNTEFVARFKLLP